VSWKEAIAIPTLQARSRPRAVWFFWMIGIAWKSQLILVSKSAFFRPPTVDHKPLEHTPKAPLANLTVFANSCHLFLDALTGFTKNNKPPLNWVEMHDFAVINRG
jgi:hypothetical protein